MSRARVVGAGVVGLTTALCLAEDGWDVEVVTAEHPLATTSSVAAAFWYPYLAGPEEAVARWGRATAARFADLAADPDVPVVARTVHEWVRASPDDPGWRSSMPDLVAASGAPPEGCVGGWEFTSWVVDMAAYVPWLVARCGDAGITVRLGRVASLEAASEGVDLVADCAGVGARELADDRRLEPVAGQVVLVDAPWVTDVWLDADHPGGATYVVPRGTAVVCGGTASRGVWDREPDPDVAADILRRCDVLVPGLAEAPVLDTRVGLRPARPEVRVHLHRKPAVPVLHHYGHGGAGVTLSWGSAREAADRARVLLG